MKPTSFMIDQRRGQAKARGWSGATIAGVDSLGGSSIDLSTAPADGDVLVYDAATDTWVLVDSSTFGTTLTVEETDGSPLVTPVSTIEVPAAGLTDNGSGSVTLEYAQRIEGGNEKQNNLGSVSGAVAVDPTDGNVIYLTLTGDVTATVAAPAGSGASRLLWWVTQNGVGGHAFTIAATAGTVTDQGTITPDTTALGTVRYVTDRVPGTGNDWIRNLVGGASLGTPALTLGTTNATGAATTAIGTDATIAAFDATVPVTQALGDSAATGSVAKAARRDHKHGMPALSTATPLVESASGSVGTSVLSSREDHVHPAAAGIAFTIIGQETRTSDGATTTWSLDNDFEANSVQAFNLTSGKALVVTEGTTPSVTIGAAGTAGDVLAFAYAASAI